jgi:hypothetical protein
VSIKDEQLKAIGKQVKRDIQAAIAQGKLPRVRYGVRTRHEWYTKDIEIVLPDRCNHLPSDQEREILVAITVRYQIPDDPFTVMIDGTIAHHSGRYLSD